MTSGDQEPDEFPRARRGGDEPTTIHVTGTVSREIRNLRQSHPDVAAAVDEAITRIPRGAGHPVRIDVPDAPPDRVYFEITPHHPAAPVVIYRRLGPGDEPDEGWLVTTLIGQGDFGAYRQAEARGILDTDFGRDVTTYAAGTVSTEDYPGGRSGRVN